MDNKNQKQYTGVWLPAHVIESEELTATEKLLYAEIASFKHCYANNTHFAKRLGITNRSVQRCLTNLEDATYIARFDDEGGERYIIALRDDPKEGGVTQTSWGGDTNVIPPMTSTSPIDTSLDTIIDKEYKEKISPDEKLDIEKLYRGWLIEMVIGFAVWQGFQDDPQARRDYLATARKKVRLTEKRRQKMLSRLRELGMADCIKAIKNVASASDFYRGNNDNKWKATIEWLFNSTEKTEEWANK